MNERTGWSDDFVKVESVRVQRCAKPGESNSVCYQLHHFADASCTAYGAVTYLRAEEPDGKTTCRLMIAKSRLAPVKTLLCFAGGSCVDCGHVTCAAVSLLHEVRELYRHRADRLQERHFDYITQWVSETFAPGRPQHLRGISSILLKCLQCFDAVGWAAGSASGL